jgi:ribosomal protein L11 methyltransferase
MPFALNIEGLHPTTVSCLEALQWLKESYDFHTILDMGCGNGILSLFAAVHWPATIVAADISAQAVADTAQRAADYPALSVVRSDGFSHPLIAEKSPYDLLIFNLLAEPLMRMSPEVKANLAPRGICILSGILTWLGQDVREAYTRQGFELLKVFAQPSWQTYVMRRD